ncbi:ATP-binding protein [Pseudomonas mosselii]|uniref:AAA family ATPase n=1 Tax=Pseudomonas mosselii TaxID=78327 RepID=UPI00244BE9A1|nr:ATP-binding protein [Pseudomonas mosselii]MDH1145247.1 ATP-binding protein [Pseudomonas mosselii]
MDEFRDVISKLVQITKIGALGDGEKVRIQALRLVRSLRETGSPIAELIQKEVFSQSFDQSASNAIRRVKDTGLTSPVPADETNSELLNVEDPVLLPNGFVSSEEIKGPLNLIVSERKNTKKLLDAGITPTSKILFTGPPGVGKTVCAKYLAQKLKVPLLTLDLATVVSSFLGKTGNNVKKALEYTRSRPCVLLIDELDAIAKKRDDHSDVGETKRLVTVLLQELDQWQGNNLLIAATNHYHLLDPAVQRRFDQIVEFKRPGVEDLMRVGLQLTAGSNAPKTWIYFVASLMEGTSYSDFQRELNNLRKVLLLDGEQGAMEHLRTLLERQCPSDDRSRRKQLALMLVTKGKASQRTASKITGVSRDTLRSALSAGA